MALVFIVRGTRITALLAVLAVFIAVVDAFTAAPPHSRQNAANQPRKTVWSGVYTAEQAARGMARYESDCGSCHGTAEAPTLVGDEFKRRWFGDNLQTLLTKMRTMPADAPGSLEDAEYVDIIAYLLQSTGFPAGPEQLRNDPELLANILVGEKEGSAETVPNFSLVQVVGCLTQRADAAWVLSNGSEPVRSRESEDSAPADLKASLTTPLGTHSFRLLDYPIFGRPTYKGERVQAKGFLMREPNDEKLSVTSLQTLGEPCGP